MEPKEKWDRLMKPQSLEDYGLSLTGSELETFEEGRELLASVLEAADRISQHTTASKKAVSTAKFI